MRSQHKFLSLLYHFHPFSTSLPLLIISISHPLVLVIELQGIQTYTSAKCVFGITHSDFAGSFLKWMLIIASQLLDATTIVLTVWHAPILQELAAA